MGGQPLAPSSGALAGWLSHAGDIFFADPNNNNIRRIDAISGVITTVAGASKGLKEPVAVTVDSHGNLFIANSVNSFGNGQILRVDGSTGTITTLGARDGRGRRGTRDHRGALLEWR